MEIKLAEALAVSLMGEHGLLSLGWQLRFDKAVTRLGMCIRSKRVISLSTHATLVNGEQQVRNTVLHEIAHALTAGHGHDGVWRSKALAIGCDGSRCNDIAVKVPAAYAILCNGCEREIGQYYRRPRARTIQFGWHIPCGKEKGRLTMITKALTPANIGGTL